MTDFNDVYEKVLHQLKIKSYPVAAKIFKKGDTVPEGTGARKPKEPLTTCQSVYIARA